MRGEKLIRILSMTLALVFTGAWGARAQEPPAAGVGDAVAVRENVRQMEDGWNRKSGALFAKPFAEDADYVVINGMQLKGRAAIEKGHQHIFDTIYKDSTLSLSVKQVRFLRPEVAVVHVTGRNKTRRGGETHEISGVLTLVMSKEKGEWRIAAFQNTEVAEGARRP